MAPLVAISSLFLGRRVVGFRLSAAPAIPLDVMPGAAGGVEVAGTHHGGRGALPAVRESMLPSSVARVDVAAVHLSLWCASVGRGIMEQVKETTKTGEVR